MLKKFCSEPMALFARMPQMPPSIIHLSSKMRIPTESVRVKREPDIAVYTSLTGNARCVTDTHARTEPMALFARMPQMPPSIIHLSSKMRIPTESVRVKREPDIAVYTSLTGNARCVTDTHART